MLARVVQIEGFEAMEGYDAIHLACLVGLGWKVVVRKADFNVGDLGVYICIGSQLGSNAWVPEDLKNTVLKTKKFKRYISQGLLGPITWILSTSKLVEGTDVTEILGVTKYVPLEEREVNGVKWPEFVPKTNEERAQNVVRELKTKIGLYGWITQKFDGSSSTFIKIGDDHMVCSHHHVLATAAQKLAPVDCKSDWLKIYDRLELRQKLAQLNFDCAIQAELIGPKINGNRHKVKALDLFVFNIWHITEARYMLWDEVVAVCRVLDLKTVPTVWEGPLDEAHTSVPQLLELAAEQRLDGGHLCEGLVLKTREFSCKIISNEYLIKYNL